MEYFSQAFGKAIRLLLSMDPELYSIIGLSLGVTLSALTLAAIAGIPLGVLIALRRFPAKSVVVNIINTLMSMPPVVVGLIVYILLSNQTGLVGERRLLFTPFAMVLAQFMLAVPLMAGLTYNALKNVDPLIAKSAKSLGARPSQVAAAMVKEARFSIYTSFIVVFGRLIAEVGAVMMVGGNIRYNTRVMTTAIAMNKGMGEFQLALALGVILLMISFLINGIIEIIRNYGRV